MPDNRVPSQNKTCDLGKYGVPGFSDRVTHAEDFRGSFTTPSLSVSTRNDFERDLEIREEFLSSSGLRGEVKYPSTSWHIQHPRSIVKNRKDRI